MIRFVYVGIANTPVEAGGFLKSKPDLASEDPMPFKEDSPTGRVQLSFQKLATAASTLNTASDQLGKLVSRLDSSFQKLNIGVPGWVRFRDNRDGPKFWIDEVGYDKLNGKWGLAIRSTSGDEDADDYTSYEQWLFNDAPRGLRIDAVDKLPDLFDYLAKRVILTKESVDQKLQTLEEFASAVSIVLGEKPSAGTVLKR